MNPEKIKKKVRTCIQENNLAEARSLISKLCDKSPNDADAWHILGAVNGMLGNNEEAEACARKVLKLLPGTAVAYNNLGSSLLAQKKLDEAESVLGTALRLSPHDPQALNNSGNLLLPRKEYARAADYFRKAIRYRPDYAEAHNNLGSALLSMDRADEAIGSFERALKLAPAYTDALYNFGQAAQALGKFDVALNAYGKALQLQPGHTPALLGAAEVLKLQGNHEQAAGCYQTVINITPDTTAAYVGYGTLLQKQAKHSEAVEMLGRALELDPECAEALHYIGASRKELGEIDVAAQYFSRALEIAPEMVQARHMLAAMGLSEAPEKADPHYIEELFDGYANIFDEHLVHGLEYHQPYELKELVAPLLGDCVEQFDVLDLGCGTGLCGPIFKPWSRSLTGVDLSRKMVARARERHVYDELVIGDIAEHLSDKDCCYDLIIAADVFVYLGKLDDVVVKCANSLRQGGVFVFSIELLQDRSSDYRLHTGGRYAHTVNYIENLAERSALSVQLVKETMQRKEKGEAVKGVIFILLKHNK